MLDIIKIQDEVNRLLVKKYPDFTCYVNKVPQNFERPSFLIEYITNTQYTVNKSTILENIYFTITYFSETDEYFNTDKFNLQVVLTNVLKIFRIGYMKVENRAINVKASSGGSNDNEVYIELHFEYYEDRLEDVEEEEYIGSIETNLNLRG